jgi:hypothetical protein
MDRAFLSSAPRDQGLEQIMSNFEVSNSTSAHCFGVYEADSPEAAIEAACKDAGYDSKAEAEAAMGRECELVAVEVA